MKFDTVTALALAARLIDSSKKLNTHVVGPSVGTLEKCYSQDLWAFWLISCEHDTKWIGFVGHDFRSKAGNVLSHIYVKSSHLWVECSNLERDHSLAAEMNEWHIRWLPVWTVRVATKPSVRSLLLIYWTVWHIDLYTKNAFNIFLPLRAESFDWTHLNSDKLSQE